MQEYKWVSVKDKPHPNKDGAYKCTLNDGKVHDVFGMFYANGWFWEFNKSLEIEFEVSGLNKPRVVAWFPNLEPYLEN